MQYLETSKLEVATAGATNAVAATRAVDAADAVAVMVPAMLACTAAFFGVIQRFLSLALRGW